MPVEGSWPWRAPVARARVVRVPDVRTEAPSVRSTWSSRRRSRCRHCPNSLPAPVGPRRATAPASAHRGCAPTCGTRLAAHHQLIFGDTPVAQPPELEAAADGGMLALRELVEQAQVEGELGAGAPRELVTVLWVLVHGLAQLQITGHLHEPRTVDGDMRLDDLLDIALAALHP
jgi:Tetracyclin repressor-like, C-terminal domain